MKDLIERLEERAASYGALRKSALTAITMDQAQSRIKELEGALGQVSITRTVRAAHFIARTTLGDKSPIHPVKTRGTE